MSSPSETEKVSRSRAIGFHSVEYLLRTLRNLGPMFRYDYESAIIALTVTTGNIQHLLNAPDQMAPYADLSTIIPGELQRPVTRLSITRATGLPRETVRRKVAALVEAGVLIKDERGGVRLTPGSLTAEPFVQVVEQNEANVRRLVRLLRPLMEDGGA